MPSSFKFTVEGNRSLLNFDIFPPLHLDPTKEYGLAILNFYGYNSINNVQQDLSNVFTFIHPTTSKSITFSLTPGSYDVPSIFEALNTALKDYLAKESSESKPEDFVITHKIIEHTGNIVLHAPFDIDVTSDQNVLKLLGFEKSRILPKNQDNWSDSPANIFAYHSINIRCDLVNDNYFNGKPSPVLYSFCPKVDLNYRIVEEISPLVYLKVNRHVINQISVSIVNERGTLLDFRGERITVVLHLIEL